MRRRGRALLEIAAGLALAPVWAWLVLRHVSGSDGFVALGDGEVAVVEGGFAGGRRVVAQPGVFFFVPGLERVERLSKSSQALVLEGGGPPEPAEIGRVPRPILRARDGSSFWFESLRVEYALIPDAAARVLDDSGMSAEVRRDLVEAHVRAILRDELGRFSPEEVARPDVRQVAQLASLERLNVALAPHGLHVLEVSTPKAAFDKAYEDKINRRKIADQEAVHLVAKLDQLEQEKAQREAAARKEKEIELKKLEGDLVRDVGLAEKERIRARRVADDVFLEKSEAGRATQIEKETQATTLAERYTGLARDLARETRELERSGELAVRRALIKKLAGIEFNLLPYSRDPAPARVEYESLPGALPLGKGSKP